METKVIGKGQTKNINLPSCFETPVRKDVISMVWRLQQKAQPYASYVLAGMEASASSKQRHRRRKYKTLYGLGVSRVPRKVMTRRGERFFWRGAFIPGTVGGRAAHPPKVIKPEIKINKKVKKLALKSAIAATASPLAFELKYKRKPSLTLPVVIESSLLKEKPREAATFIFKILSALEIGPKKKIRAGKGKARGRVYKKVLPLIITSSAENTSANKLRNFGFEIANTKQLNISALAPGGIPGRLVVWTEDSIKELESIK